MDTQQVREITTERLADWRNALVRNHATPVALIGVGHDHNSGELHLCITEDMPVAVLQGFLAWAVRELEARR